MVENYKEIWFVTDSGNILVKIRFNLALGDIFQGALLPTYYKLFSIGINLEPHWPY